MTDRERWTVYPLLFLALGVSVKDKIIRFVDVDDVVCNRLVVTDREGREQVMIVATPGGGKLQVQNNNGTDRITIGAGPQGILRVHNGIPSVPLFAQPRAPQQSAPAGGPDNPPPAETGPESAPRDQEPEQEP